MEASHVRSVFSRACRLRLLVRGLVNFIRPIPRYYFNGWAYQPIMLTRDAITFWDERETGKVQPTDI